MTSYEKKQLNDFIATFTPNQRRVYLPFLMDCLKRGTVEQAILNCKHNMNCHAAENIGPDLRGWENWKGEKIPVERFHALRALELDETATDEDIKKAYRRLAKLHHPDTGSQGSSEAKMASINVAYELLTKEQ